MDKDQMRDVGHAAKADIKETTGVTSGNSESRPGDKVEKSTWVVQPRTDGDDDILELPEQ